MGPRGQGSSDTAEAPARGGGRRPSTATTNQRLEDLPGHAGATAKVSPGPFVSVNTTGDATDGGVVVIL